MAWVGFDGGSCGKMAQPLWGLRQDATATLGSEKFELQSCRMQATLLNVVAGQVIMSRYPDVKCPTCKKKGPWLDGPTGQFCGKRCKMVDLGKWFNGEMVIEEPLRADHFEGYGDLPPGAYLDQPE